MALLKPFAGARPPADLVQKIAAPPYDVVNRSEARAYAQGNPYSFFHVSRPEIDLPDSIDEHAAEVYRLGKEHLDHFLARGWLKRDPAPRFYLYRQQMGNHIQTGVVGTASVEEYDQSLIKKHEHTRPDKEQDRVQHIEALCGNDEPVFLTYRSSNQIDGLVADASGGEPEYDFETEDRIRHTFWVLDERATAQIGAAFQRIEMLYIADGHHRSAAASRVCALRRRQKKSGSHDYFLAVIFPHNQMQILDYNRAVKDLAGRTPQQFLDAVRSKFDLRPTQESKPRAPHRFGMFFEGRWYALEAKTGSFPQTPTGVLDISILQENLLKPILGISDPRKDQRIHFVGGIRGTQELEKLVQSGDYAVAFSLFPTSLDQLMAIADAGEVMPPKSTWFEPKLRSGLVLHLFE